MIKRICVVGGGTAGWIAASYIKQACQNLVDVTIIYNHDEPAIGVGESTTPVIMDYLRMVGISYKDLIKEIGTTLKFGIKFTNWNGDNNRYYHTFSLPIGIPPYIADKNLIAAHEVANLLNTGGETYGTYACDKMLVPVADNNECPANFALHIDSLKFSEYIRERFKDRVRIIDDIITSVEVEEGRISHIIGEKSGKITADVFIDASGFESILMKKLENVFVDKSDYLYTDSAFTCQIENTKDIPPYTEAIATEDGWIWKVPLQSRFGTGYVYSSKHTTDEDARSRFETFLKSTFNKTEFKISTKPIRFKPGYWKEQWKGNCVAIGLSSGFAEPLEATAIHMITNQIRMFTGCWEMRPTLWSQKKYNKLAAGMYEQTFDFIRLHYHTKREDSPFWLAWKENQPEWLIDYSEKCSKSMITTFDVYDDWDRILGSKIFGLPAYTRVSMGLEMFNSVAVKNWLLINGYTEVAEDAYKQVESQKNQSLTYIKHDTYLKMVLGS